MAKNGYTHAGYLENAIPTGERNASIARVLKIIRTQIKKGLVFDTVAFSGMSGALIAPIVAIRLKKETIMIRKLEDGSHSYRDSKRVFEGFRESRRYIIVDDFIFSGETIARIKAAVKGATYGAKLVGVALYNPRPENFVTRYNG